MTHEQPTPAPVEVTRMDHDRALEVFNDILCDMGNYVESGAPHYKHEALETIASHCARHRSAHSAPAGEVEPVAMQRTIDRLHRELADMRTKYVDALAAHPAPPADVVELVDALRWYQDQVSKCNSMTDDTGRNELARDLGQRATAALAKHGGA